MSILVIGLRNSPQSSTPQKSGPASQHKPIGKKVMSESTNERAIYRILIEAPITAVWSELVKTDDVLPFFFGAVCRTTGELAPGRPMAMESPGGKYRSVVGEVIKFSPPYLYSHTFKFTGFDDPPCIVTYKLKEVEGGVEFTLITENVPAGTQTAKAMAQGGPFITQTLKALVEAGRPSLGQRLMLTMMSLTAIFTPASCKSESWPFARITNETGLHTITKGEKRNG